jgi:hypothetical protein
MTRCIRYQVVARAATNLLTNMGSTVRMMRQERETRRIRRAVEAVRVGQRPAMAAALAQIGAAFDEAAIISSFKIRVERLVRLGADHPAVRARFAARGATLFGRDLHAAVVIVEGWWRDERKAFQIASVLGCATRLSFEIVRELRLILRLMRFKRMETEYESALAAVCDVPTTIAAE